MLFVADEAFLRKLVPRLLADEGYEVVLAASGEAIERLNDLTPDLILLALADPPTEGIELGCALRQLRVGAAVPLVFLGAGDPPAEAEAALEIGDAYINAPFDAGDLLVRVAARLARGAHRSTPAQHDLATDLLSPSSLSAELDREFSRFSRGGAAAAVASVSFDELARLAVDQGRQGIDLVMRRAAERIRGHHRALDLVARTDVDEITLLLPETSADDAQVPLQRLTSQVVVQALHAENDELRLTPIIGVADFRDGDDVEAILRRARTARRYAATQQDLLPMRWGDQIRRWDMGQPARTPLGLLGRGIERLGPGAVAAQIALTFLIGPVLPFLLYVQLDQLGYDVTKTVYLVVVVALVLTAALIWGEWIVAMRRPEPPAEPGEPYPPATAIIAAYLPNEAPTIVSTVEAFLAIDYPGELEIVLAYNTTDWLPVEAELASIATRHPRVKLRKVEHSSSKAQNVNAALQHATGRFIGVFDADHHPSADSFRRAWRWLSNGYSVVQGRCVVRNGPSTLVTRLVAVEFEAIYAVSHPGRAGLHGFGIFGGSNGYWRTEVLHQIRMRSMMLTEDIDSSMRVLMAGQRIASDPGLISTELATTTWRQLWNQRMRWAQGWTQVSTRHIWRGLASKRLGWRQKLGLGQLLLWRELYPWISLQILPLAAFWIWRQGGLDWFVPIFVLTTLLTLSVGPGQVLLAYHLGSAEIRAHRRWFVAYLLLASLFYVEFKNVIARVAQLRQLLGEREWVVTPREQPVGLRAEPPTAATVLNEAEAEGRTARGTERRRHEPRTATALEALMGRYLPRVRRFAQARPLDGLIIAAQLDGLPDPQSAEVAAEAGLARASISGIRGRRRELRERYRQFAVQDFSDTEWVAVFIESIALPEGTRATSSDALVAWGITSSRRRALIWLGASGRPIDWDGFVTEIRTRGVIAPRMVVTPPVPALRDAVAAVWPEAGQQLSASHRIEELCNLLPPRGHLRGQLRHSFWNALNHAETPHEGAHRLAALSSTLRRSHPVAARFLTTNAEALTVHLDHPSAARKQLRSATLLKRSLQQAFRRREIARRRRGDTDLLFATWSLLDLLLSTSPRLPQAPTAPAAVVENPAARLAS